MENKVSDVDVQRICGFLADRTGLDFPRSRWSDLRRGIAAAAKEMGVESCAEYTARLTMPSAKKELEFLVNHLTVGETYFFREKQSFEILAERILPAIIRARREEGRHLRIWSAACCTGEEPYSIAIVLHRLLPDWAGWNITLLATDINSRFLRKAISGVFGKWSFRDAPPWLRGYFRPSGDGHFEITPDIKKIVRFAQLNLVDDMTMLTEGEASGMDVIFCRNVLMYFTEAQAQKVIQRLHRAQSDGGWLFVGPGELTNVSGVPYVAATGHGAILFQKHGEAAQKSPVVSETEKWAPTTETKTPPVIPDQPREIAVENAPPQPAMALGELAIVFANQGKLSQALQHCDQWIANNRLNPASHCLRAVILQELCQVHEAVRSLRTALYLDPNCVQAHFILGNIARKHGELGEASRHLRNARTLLSRFPSDDPLPDFEGITAGRFLQMINSLIEREVAA